MCFGRGVIDTPRFGSDRASFRRIPTVNHSTGVQMLGTKKGRESLWFWDSRPGRLFRDVRTVSDGCEHDGRVAVGLWLRLDPDTLPHRHQAITMGSLYPYQASIVSDGLDGIGFSRPETEIEARKSVRGSRLGRFAWHVLRYHSRESGSSD